MVTTGLTRSFLVGPRGDLFGIAELDCLCDTETGVLKNEGKSATVDTLQSNLF